VFEKIKNVELLDLPVVAANLGLVAMAAAATIGSMPEHFDSRVVLPNQPVLARAESSDQSNPLRREKEETAAHFISYSEVQRTPSRSGKS
jgi:hypothetical protein